MSVEDAIEKALIDGKQIVASPRTIKALKERGVNVPDDSRIVPWEEYIDKVFSDENRRKALKRVQKLPRLPSIPVPAVIALYKEILKCIALGVNGAAITLSCLLVEYMLKYATYKTEAGGFKIYDKARWDEFEDLEFGDAIGRAAKNRLLTKKNKAALHEFREEIRNPYLHYNLKKITANIIASNVQTLDHGSGDISVSNIPAIDDPTIQPGAKTFVDEKRVVAVFTFANNLVIDLWSKIEHLLESPKS